MLTTAHLRCGLNALGRAAAGDYFADGHKGGAIVSGFYLCKESAVEAGVTKRLAEAVDRQWGKTKLCAEFPDQAAQPKLAQRLVDAMLANITGLRQAGHNVILPTLALKGFGDCPQAITPARVEGLCQLALSFTQVEKVESDEEIQCPGLLRLHSVRRICPGGIRRLHRALPWPRPRLVWPSADLRPGLDRFTANGPISHRRQSQGAASSRILRRIHLGPLERDIPRNEPPTKAPYATASRLLESAVWRLEPRPRTQVPLRFLWPCRVRRKSKTASPLFRRRLQDLLKGGQRDNGDDHPADKGPGVDSKSPFIPKPNSDCPFS